MAGRIMHPFALLLLFALLLTGFSAADGEVLDLVSSDDSGIVVRVAPGELDIEPVVTDTGTFTAIEVPDFGFEGRVGAPQLPVLRNLIEVPLGASWTMTIADAVYREIPLSAPVMPQQPPIPKNNDPRPAFAIDAAAYARVGYANPATATLTEVGFVRGHRLAQLSINAVDYDPAAETIRVLESATVRVVFSGVDRIATDAHHARYSSPPFDNLVHAVTLNGTGDRYKPVGEVGYLVISTPSLTGNADLAELLSWKEQKGFHVTHVSTDITGPTKESILSYIQMAYDTWPIPPTFILLVGDTPDIPHWTGSGTGSPATDLNYTMLEGTDYLPDIALGRFSVTNPTQLHNIVAKTLSFERIEWTGNDEWEKYVTFMASEDNWSVSEGTHNWVISTYLEPLGYQWDKLYCHTYGATTQQVRNAFNEGRAQGTFSGHGSETSWADGPVFTQNDVNSLTNTVYPLIQSYACVTGYFARTECFGETWIRASGGAVAFWGSSVNSYWTEDDILEKRLYEGFYDNQYPENIVNQTWVGGMTNYAKLRYYDYFGNSGMTRRYMEMYNIMGDASVDVWTDVPAAAMVDAPATLMAGTTTFDLSVMGTPYAMVSVRKSDGGNNIFMTAWGDPLGNVTVNLPESLNPGELTIAVTAHDKEPYFETIQVVQPSGPYLVFESCDIEDGRGNGNGLADAGESIGIDVTLGNVGIDPATGVTGLLSSVDPYADITTSHASYSDIPADGSGSCVEPYAVDIAGNVPDQRVIQFSLRLNSNEGSWDAEFDITAQAPVLTDGSIEIDDSPPGGDASGGADPGETFLLYLNMGNVGHSDAGTLTGTLTCDDTNVVIHDDTAQCTGVPVGGAGRLSVFQVEILPGCPSPSTITFDVAIAGADGFEADLSYDISIGAFFFDDAEADRGWTFGAPDDDASSGQWTRADPIGTTYNSQQCQPEDDHTPAPGVQCFVTANGSVGGTAGEADVDGGKTTLLTPVFDLSDAVSASIEYWRWYTNDLGNNPGEDYWDVDVTADGENWVSLEHTNASANSWTQYSFNLGDFVGLTEQVQIRFVASDEINGSLVEAAVDDFILTAVIPPSTDDVSEQEILANFGLVSCHPNPFNPRMAVVYRIGHDTKVSLCLYDVAGRVVRTLVDDKVAAGEHTITFDGRDDLGRAVSSGIYFLRMETAEILSIKQVALLK